MFKPVQTHENAPAASVITLLRRLLSEAEQGKISNIGSAAVDENGRPFTNYAAGIPSRSMPLIIAAELLKARLLAEALDLAEETFLSDPKPDLKPVTTEE